MTCEYAFLSTRITIDSTNKTIDFKRNTTPYTATLTEGNYYVFGNGTDDLDLCKNIKEAFETADSGTYSVNTYIWETKTRNISELTIGHSVDQIQVLTSGTFDMSVLGFTADTALAYSAVSDSNILTIWMSDQPYFSLRNIEVKSNQKMHLSKGGQPYFYRNAVTQKNQIFDIKNTCKRRTLHHDDKENSSDSFETFFEHLSTGVYVKVFVEAMPSGVIFEASLDNVVVSGVLNVERMPEFKFAEISPAANLYSWQIPILEVAGV